MINAQKVIALIPARGGSKRLPRKNVMTLGGMPLIAWSIKAASGSKYVDEVFVSTDDTEISEVAKKYGALVPFMRPSELAADKSTTNDVILHAIDALELKGNEVLVVLQPTSPLRKSSDIDLSIELLEGKQASGVVSVCECEHSPLWSNKLPSDRNLSSFISDEALGKRSQDIETFYRLNGAIYAYKCQDLKDQNGIFYNKNVFAHIMNRENSVDIDFLSDFKLAEFYIENNDSI